MNWYTIRVVTSKEKKIKELIETELRITKLDNKISQLLIPSKKVTQMRNGKKYSITKNDFPGYILIETENIQEIESTIKQVNGVIGFLGVNSPEALRKHEVDKLIIRQTEVDVEDGFFVGESVTVTDGPFSSFIGTITQVDDKKKTVKANIKVFDRDVPVDLTYEQINKK